MSAHVAKAGARFEDLEAAWDWVLKLRDEQASQEDLATWLQWYEADERHRQAFEEMQAFWHDSGRLAEGDLARLLDAPPPLPAAPLRPARRTALWAASRWHAPPRLPPSSSRSGASLRMRRRASRLRRPSSAKRSWSTARASRWRRAPW
jgi:hypothetical protein